MVRAACRMLMHGPPKTDLRLISRFSFYICLLLFLSISSNISFYFLSFTLSTIPFLDSSFLYIWFLYVLIHCLPFLFPFHLKIFILNAPQHCISPSNIWNINKVSMQEFDSSISLLLPILSVLLIRKLQNRTVPLNSDFFKGVSQVMRFNITSFHPVHNNTEVQRGCCYSYQSTGSTVILAHTSAIVKWNLNTRKHVENHH